MGVFVERGGPFDCCNEGCGVCFAFGDSSVATEATTTFFCELTF